MATYSVKIERIEKVLVEIELMADSQEDARELVKRGLGEQETYIDTISILDEIIQEVQEIEEEPGKQTTN